VITWGFRLRRRRVEDSVQYWIDRHQRLSQKLASVGDVRRTEDENTTLYAWKKREVFDVLRALGLTDLSDLSLLDAGCGNGVVSEFFWALGASVSGVDVSDEALRQAALRVPLGTFHRRPLTSFNLQREYDIVFCGDVLYHIIDNTAWRQALERLVRHASPGGYLFVLEHLKPHEDSPARHVRHRTLPMYHQALRAMGLIEQPVEKPQMNLVWRRP
jgi:2-polyprenyl-3-methyl-5-hydroxy-6-metoxy-1,4-benzoquinol methylase